ncbi:MAG: PAS domain-containing sensor histidine kinase [Robiginitomaculum sp.]|nr:PAS domain-containing sensor histidine kinase [Robiginitomaculum sp.]
MNDTTHQDIRFVSPRVFSTALFGALFAVAASLTGIGALSALSGNAGQAQYAIPALWLSMFFVFTLGVYLFFRLKSVLFSDVPGQNVPYLHRRFILIFSLGALVPAILVGLFFSTLMNRNLNDIFGPNISQTMEMSEGLSTAYFNEERREIGQGVYDIADDLNRAEGQLTNRITYTDFLINQAVFREFPVVYVIDGRGRILSKAESPQSPPYILPSKESYQKTKDGTVVYITRGEVDFIGALYKLENYKDAFLYTGRYLQPGLLKNIDQINLIQTSLTNYKDNSTTLKRVFLLSYIEVALLILFVAIWMALVVADRIVSPLGVMVKAAEKVRSGDLVTRLNVVGAWDEISDLANAFNRMTKQLFTQREDLVREHNISEQRREFSEAVLSGVSAGVIGLSQEGRITIINNSAERLLGLTSHRVVGQPLVSELNEFMPAFRRAVDNLGDSTEDQVNIETPTGMRNLDLRVSPYQGNHSDTGWVITFDDMTRLVSAQRHSAWREVARRIAHEIKNPLTPILLSAERLQRKYKDEIISDPEVFTQCTETITKQVGNLGRMVDEFSAFARMPAPVLEMVNLQELLSDTIFAQRVSFPDVEFFYENLAGNDVSVFCDERLISQALTNIYKNAGESIIRRLHETGDDRRGGIIRTYTRIQDDMVVIDITDNGLGWPLMDKERLLEPYMTTRDEGTGLGLAIVKRIAEDHGGSFYLLDRVDEKPGAHVRFCLPETDMNASVEIPQVHTITRKSQDINL